MISVSLPALLKHRSIRPTNYASAFEMMKVSEKLNSKEQDFHDALLNVNSDTFWGHAIRNVFIDYTVMKFRELICELLSQNDDNEDMMFRILGKTAYDLLLKLKP